VLALPRGVPSSEAKRPFSAALRRVIVSAPPGQLCKSSVIRPQQHRLAVRKPTEVAANATTSRVRWLQSQLEIQRTTEWRKTMPQSSAALRMK
jgi:hypothetical protein